jgi:hypothetical protein
MKKSLLVLAMIAMGLASCQPTPKMTVKFTEMDCTYDGPSSIPFGKFIVNWIVNDQKHNKTGLIILTLADGKTIDDLRAVLGSEAISWAHRLWTDEENAFVLDNVRSYSHEHDLRAQADYQGGPLYMVCGNEERATGVLGPIQVIR